MIIRNAVIAVSTAMAIGCSFGATGTDVVIGAVGDRDGAYIISFDPSSVRLVGAYRQAWVRHVYNKTQTMTVSGKTLAYGATLSLLLFNCDVPQLSVKLILYKNTADDSTVGRDDFSNLPLLFTDIIPKSSGESTQEKVCLAPPVNIQHKP